MSRTALWRAVEGAYKDVVKLLLENGANTEIGEADYGHTALSLAAYLGHLSIIQNLLQRGTEIYRPDKNGRKPFSWAV